MLDTYNEDPGKSENEKRKEMEATAEIWTNLQGHHHMIDVVRLVKQLTR